MAKQPKADIPPTQVQAAAKPTIEQRNEAARQFAIELARLATDTMCRDVNVLDVRGLSPVTDFMVIGTGTSPRQMRSVCDEAGELGEQRNYSSLSRSGTEGDSWMLIDFIDVVVHVFNQESRSFYDLDGLWGDAARVAWGETNTKT